MAKASKKKEAVEIDPNAGDAILKRMLRMKPKPHKEMVKKSAKSGDGNELLAGDS